MPVITVSALTRVIEQRLKSDVRMQNVTVRGELTEFKVNANSGHAYFSLREGGAFLKCVMWKSRAEKLRYTPEAGMEVLCTGEITVYKGGGYYQLSATEIAPMGEGMIAVAQRQLRERLDRLGIFSPERKKPIPQLPAKIAIVTSSDGAAIHDFVKVMRTRYPIAEIFPFHAQVQGENAHLTLASAIAAADRSGCDVLVVTRGGGPSDNLSAFNTEEVAMAIANCRTPVISAVGHEIDTTLADYAADVRVPTPTAAAECCAPDISVLIGNIDHAQEKLTNAFSAVLRNRRADLERQSVRLSDTFDKNIKNRSAAFERLCFRLKNASPEQRIEKSKIAVSNLTVRMNKAFENDIARRRAQIENASGRLEALSPFNVLERGYTITMKGGVPVTRPEQLSEGDTVIIRFSGFTAEAVIRGIRKDG